MEDSILENNLFSINKTEDETNEFYHSIVKLMLAAGAPLPSFYALEPQKIHHVVSWDGKVFTATGLKGEYVNIKDMYDVLEKLNGDSDFIFDESVGNAPGVSSMGEMVFVDNKNQDILLGYLNPDTNAYFSYYRFLSLAKEWLDNQENAMLAYNFINLHPAFWYRDTNERYQYDWITTGGQKTMDIWVSDDDKGRMVVSLEHGEAVNPERNYHAHNSRLDIYAYSFEDAYIKMAKAVHRLFDLSGNMR